MIPLPSGAKVWLATGHTDMHEEPIRDEEMPARHVGLHPTRPAGAVKKKARPNRT